MLTCGELRRALSDCDDDGPVYVDGLQFPIPLVKVGGMVNYGAGGDVTRGVIFEMPQLCERCEAPVFDAGEYLCPECRSDD